MFSYNGPNTDIGLSLWRGELFTVTRQVVTLNCELEVGKVLLSSTALFAGWMASYQLINNSKAVTGSHTKKRPEASGYLPQTCFHAYNNHFMMASGCFKTLGCFMAASGHFGMASGRLKTAGCCRAASRCFMMTSRRFKTAGYFTAASGRFWLPAAFRMSPDASWHFLVWPITGIQSTGTITIGPHLFWPIKWLLGKNIAPLTLTLWHQPVPKTLVTDVS